MEQDNLKTVVNLPPVSALRQQDGMNDTPTKNGISVNTETLSEGLTILIIGAGIGGLTAATSLRQNGHKVHLFEQSAFSREFGAGISLGPNACGILERLAIDTGKFGVVPRKVTQYNAAGEVLKSFDLRDHSKIWKHPRYLVHRIDLHDELKKAAISETRAGVPAKLHLNSKVVEIDARAASITLETGETITGDVIIGADGIHSIARKAVPGGDIKPFGSGKSAFRFMIPKEDLDRDPKTQRIFQEDGTMAMWFGMDRRIISYPTSNSKLINFVCIHPTEESDGSDDWSKPGSLEKMLEVYQKFDPSLLALLSKADEKTLKVWKLLDMEMLPSWVNERLALLGDAAHPYLPYQAQGAGAALEDAAALSVVLQGGTQSDVPERLKLYEKIRYERAHRIQHLSQMIGQDIKEEKKFDTYANINYNYGHDEVDNSNQKLREHLWSKDETAHWRAPLGFGPTPDLSHELESNQVTFTAASIKFKTSRTLLQNLFPPNRKGYRFKDPGTIACATILQTTLNSLPWTGRSTYSRLGLYFHDVQYEGEDGVVTNGVYLPVIFQSLTDSISGEEVWMPKVYGSIETTQTTESYSIEAGWHGTTWGKFSLSGLQEIETDSQDCHIWDADDGIIVHRYVPGIDHNGKEVVEAEYPVLLQTGIPKSQIQKVWKANKVDFMIDEQEKKALPTLHHIISRLSELPVYEIIHGKIFEGHGQPERRQAKRLE